MHLSGNDILGALRPYEIPLLFVSLVVGAAACAAALRRRARTASEPKGAADTALRVTAVVCVAFALNSFTDISGKLFPHVSSTVYPAVRLACVLLWVGVVMALLRTVERRFETARASAHIRRQHPPD